MGGNGGGRSGHSSSNTSASGSGSSYSNGYSTPSDTSTSTYSSKISRKHKNRNKNKKKSTKHPKEDDLSNVIRGGQNKFHNLTPIAEHDPEDYLLPNYLKHLETKKEQAKKETTKMEIMKRAVMLPNIKWKDPSQFDSFKTKLTGHFRQCHAGYLFDERFQGLYKEYGLAAVDHWCVEPGLPQLSRLQFKLDLESLMGALQSAIVASYGKLEVMKYENTQDGLSAWLEIVKKIGKGGSKRKDL